MNKLPIPIGAALPMKELPAYRALLLELRDPGTIPQAMNYLGGLGLAT